MHAYDQALRNSCSRFIAWLHVHRISITAAESKISGVGRYAEVGKAATLRNRAAWEQKVQICTSTEN